VFTASQKKTVLLVVKTDVVGKVEKCVNCNGFNRKYFIRVNLPLNRLLFSPLKLKAMAHFIFGRF